jgi:hypothetical protein
MSADISTQALALLLDDAACVGITIARGGGTVYLHAIVDRPTPNYKINVTAKTFADAFSQLVDRLRGGKAS